MESRNHFQTYFGTVQNLLSNLDIDSIQKATDVIEHTIKSKKTIYIFGNGGSGSTASHVAGDWVKGVSYGNDTYRVKIMCLNDNFAGLSAISNDISYDDIFVEPLKNFVTAGDLVIGISGSGNSENVVRAIEYANSQNALTLGLVSFKGGIVKDISNYTVHVDHNDMEMAEDVHLMIFHAIKQELMKRVGTDVESMGSKYDERVK